MFQIPTANDLVTFIKDFTGSTNDAEIKKCIFMAELSMRNIELPALRSDPYAPENIGVANQLGQIPIPGDMNKPILFFKQGQQYTTNATATGTTGQTTITLTSQPLQTIQVGMVVTGTGIGEGCTVYAAASSNVGSIITLTVANAGTVSGTINFTTVGSASSQTGPWIVYDRIGDRDIITQGMVAQLYLQPVNVPAVIRGKFSEVGQVYEFLPYVAQGDLINMYYYKAWPLLFAPIDNTPIGAGNVDTVTGSVSPWSINVTVDSTAGLFTGCELTCVDDGGNFGTGTCILTSIDGPTTFTAEVTGGTIPDTGSVLNIEIVNQTVQSNAVLQTWVEGYVYSTLREYYIKRHNAEDAAVYASKYDNAWNIVSDQNNLGKWSGGHTRLTSVWQPRQYRQYNIK
jgi:hypothetical protein